MADQRTTVDQFVEEQVDPAVKDIIETLFQPLTAGMPGDEAVVDLITPEGAKDFLDRIGVATAVLGEEDEYDDALAKLDGQVETLRATEDALLAAVFEEIRPVEETYRALNAFFANAEVPEARVQAKIPVHLFNVDPKAIDDPAASPAMEVIAKYIESKNGQYNFREAINTLVVPGWINLGVRKRFEEIADKWGMLLVGDLRDEKSFDDVIDGFEGRSGLYQSLKRPQDQAASDVVLAQRVKVRDAYWFENPQGDGEDGLYTPASILFAGAIVRSDRKRDAGIAQGPVGMRHGIIKGIKRARFEPLKHETERLTMECQVVTVIRNADDDLCFMGSRNLADDPGVMKFFTTYRMFRFIERMLENRAHEVIGEALNRDMVDERVLTPIKEFLHDLRERKQILKFELNHDYDEEEYAKGILSLDVVITPVGPAEDVRISIKAPNLSSAKAKTE